MDENGRETATDCNVQCAMCDGASMYVVMSVRGIDDGEYIYRLVPIL